MKASSIWKTSFRRVAAAICVVSAPLCLLSAAAGADGLESAGNVDGVLTWRLGELRPGATAREVVFFAFDATYEGVAKRLEAARERFRSPSDPPPVDRGAPPPRKAWIRGDATDFALEGPCFFSWKSERQALSCAAGGQLSQFTFYVHYRDSLGRHRAGTPQEGDTTPENLRIVDPPRLLGPAEAMGAVETADGKLRVRVRADASQGSLVAIEFLLSSSASETIEDLTLTTYANMEAAHDHENDYSVLDARTAGLLVVDPPSGMCVVMAGLRDPSTGHSGVWDSIEKLRAPSGVPFGEWKPFRGLPAEISKRLAREGLAARGIYLPYSQESPVTPETRALTPAEAEDALRRDWLFQAMGRNLIERTAAEIGWARKLAGRLSKDPRTGDLRRDIAELEELDERLHALAGADAGEGSARELYFAVRRAKRRIAFKNPLLDFTRVLFIDQPMPRGRVNDIHESIHRMGITATAGGRLLLLEGLHPGGTVTKLAPDRPGSFWRPDLSFDARKVLFCFKPHEEKSFHLYEMGIDGSALRQLTSSDYDDIDPIYLPDGHILFTTTRGNSHVRCGPFIYSYILARCDADGGNIYLISYNGEPDFVPSLLDDGRVIYSRWEYTDKPLWRVQSLWTTQQDGTGTSAFWGNQSVWPDHLSEPRQIPGTRRVMFSGVGHHDWFSGSIGIVDPGKGLNYPQGLTKVTCDLRWPECSLPPADTPESRDYHASGAYTGYKTAFPLGEQDFLVSARGESGKFRLYLMDTDGNRELIYEGAHNVWHAIPVKPRRPPPGQPDGVVWPGTGASRKPLEPAFFFSADVYEGVPEIPRGSARYLRVMQLDHKTYTTWAKTYRHSGPPVSIVQEDGVKRVVSIVPVEEDGSVYFEVPPGRSLYFQLLDEEHRCLQTMRSFAGAMPGERRGCLGCHELRATAPPAAGGLAFRRPPTAISPPPWGDESIGYERFAQPVLDRYCGECHQGKGDARKTLDLTLRPGHDVFKEPYLTLVGAAGWGNPVPDRGQAGYGIAGAIPVESMDPTMNDPKAYATLPPMTYLSRSSKLVEHAGSGKHHGVKADPLSLRRLMAWVDACCPFLGEPEIRAIADPDFEGIADLPIRPRVRTAPLIERP